MSEMDSLPSASITAVLIDTRPRSWAGVNRRRAMAPTVRR